MKKKKKTDKLEVVGNIIDLGEIIYYIFRGLYGLIRLIAKIFN